MICKLKKERKVTLNNALADDWKEERKRKKIGQGDGNFFLAVFKF